MAIIDSGLNIHDPRFKGVLCEPELHRDFTGTGLYDTVGHGTHVAGILVKSTPNHEDYCIVVIKAWDKDNNWMLQAIDYANSIGVDFINISMSGSEYYEAEFQAIKKSKATFVVAAGNTNVPYTEAYPGGYKLKNIVVAGNWNCITNKKEITSNYGPEVVWRCGTNIRSYVPGGTEGYKTGTSMAAPVVTAELVTKAIKNKELK